MATFYKLSVLLLFVAFGFSSCRKKIDTDHYNEPATEATWQRISPSYCEELFALEVYKNKLYFGGDFYTAYGPWGNLGWYDASDASFGTWNYSYEGDGGVYDLQLYNNKLYAAGNFNYQGTSYTQINLLYLSNTEIEIPVNFANYQPMSIYGLGTFNDSLVITGDFYHLPSNTPDINTTNVELLTTSNVMVGAADAPSVLYGSCEHNGELYVCGESGYFAYFTGGSWGIIDYPGKTTTDRVYDITSMGDYIVLLGKFSGTIVMRAFDTATGTWTTVADVFTEADLKLGAGFKKIGTDLYMFGNDLFSSQTKYTNVFKSTDGLNWTPVGELREDVRDIALYESQFYAATQIGLFCLKK